MEGLNWKAAPLGHIFKSEGHMNLLLKKKFLFSSFEWNWLICRYLKKFPCPVPVCNLYENEKDLTLSKAGYSKCIHG